ncbi:MAG: gliding motility-associated C-terminal domain-containing protein [Saprospiraceae bacterium]
MQTVTGCDSIVTLSLSLFTPPQPEIVGPDKFCQGNSAQIAVSETYFAYVWSDGQTSKQIDVSSQGPITVTVSDSNGCQGLATINLSEIPPIDANWNLVDPLCNGASNGLIELQNIIGGLQPFSYQINNSLSTNDAVFMDLPAGDWKLMVTDSAGCTASFPLTLNDPPMLTLQLSAPTSLKAGESAQIQAQVDPPGNYDYTWSPTTGLSCTDCPNPMVSLQESTSYVLTVNDKNDCAATASIGIQVIPVAPALYTPTIFSPNEDGENDYFTIFGDPAIFQKIEVLRIFDRWGSLVFDGRDLPVNEEKFGWDGRQKGKWCLPGVFVFDAVVRLNNGEQIMKKGGVTVLR